MDISDRKLSPGLISKKEIITNKTNKLVESATKSISGIELLPPEKQNLLNNLL